VVPTTGSAVTERGPDQPARITTASRWRVWAIASLAIVAAAAAIELAMGRVPICTCGYVKLWHGVVNSSENSQHLTDWYTFSHVLHGIAFYALFWLVARRLPPGARFVLAVLLEATWEVVENTPFVINRYRAATISLNYYGDSVINSMSDIAAMMVGFAFARKAPVWMALAIVVLFETMMAVVIRDNLTLNIVMLIHPFEVIRRWQMGA
jgi:hypothetical protein